MKAGAYGSQKGGDYIRKELQSRCSEEINATRHLIKDRAVGTGPSSTGIFLRHRLVVPVKAAVLTKPHLYHAQSCSGLLRDTFYLAPFKYEVAGVHVNRK